MANSLNAKELFLFKKLQEKRRIQSLNMMDHSMSALIRGSSDIYPDPAHFVYELLQNADDAQATEAYFYLQKDTLIFKHNGSRQFTITEDGELGETVKPSPYGDINAITAYNSSKDEKQNTIGKFGLGFKSVYIYTDRPEIYDDKFWFAIENRMVPVMLDSDHPYREPGETLFVLPLNDAVTSVNEIANKLNSLSAPTLFLRHLNTVHVENEVYKNSHKLTKEEILQYESGNIRYEFVKIEDYGLSSEMLLFHRNVKAEGTRNLEVTVGFFFNKDGDIDTLTTRGIHCYFPTKETFGLCFISHAPFLLTNNRQNINESPINTKLIKEICRLAADALVIIRDYATNDKQLITDNLYEILPFKYYNEQSTKYEWQQDFNHLTSKIHFLNAVKDLLKKEPLLYTISKKYVTSKKACFLETSKLRPILNVDEVRTLKKKQNLELLKIDEDADLRVFLKKYLEIESFGPSDLANMISSDFMNAQTTEWVIRFYKYLYNEARNLWNRREKGAFALSPYPFRYAPIFLTQKNEWVAAYRKEGQSELPNLFLPFGDETNEYNFINKIYYDLEDNDVKSFYSQLGLKRPDVLDFVRDQILEKYRGEEIEIDVNLLKSDFYTIFDIFNDKQYKEKLSEITSVLNKDFYIVGTDGKLHHVYDIYAVSDDLKEFFRNNKSVAFIDYNFYLDNSKKITYNDIENFFLHLDIKDAPRIIKKEGIETWSLNSVLSNKQFGVPKHSTRGYQVWDFNLEGLETLLKGNITRKNSLFLWEFLCKIDLSKYCKGVYNYHYRSWYSENFESTLLLLLKSNKWLFNGNGKLSFAKDVYQEDLVVSGYAENEKLFELLEIGRKEISIIELGGSEVQQRQQELGAYLERKGISSTDDLDEYIRWKQEQEAKKQTSPNTHVQSLNQESLRSDERPDPLRSNQRKTNLDEMSSSTAQYPDRTPRVERSQDERVNDITQKLADEANRRIEEENKRAQVEDLEKYSKIWFTTLLELEYSSTSEPTGNRNGVKITFEHFGKEEGSERIYQLTNPSRNIPIWLEELGGFAVKFTFFNRDDITFDFEVANVKDFTLRVKAKASDVELIDIIDWSRCTKAVIDVNSPVEIMHKLKNEFENLPYKEEFNFRDGLTDSLSFVFGPPGTGKTTRLAEIIRHKMELDNCRILVLAPTNKACDVLTRKLIETSTDEHFWLGRFVATGEEFIENNGALIDRASELYEQNKCCIVSTIARLPYDGFTQSPNKMLLRDIEWDFIIVDEASMIPLVQIVYAIYKLNSKVIVAGDPLQIAPIVKEEAWVGENIYTMVKLDNFENPTTTPIQFSVEKLGTQYRSLPSIGTLYSEYCYNGKLRHKRTLQDSRNLPTGNIKAKQVNFIPFRVERYDSIYGAKKLQGSNVHVYSAIFSVEMCAYLAKQQTADKVRIGVICPYAPQAQLINKMIEQRTDIPINVDILVGTIHGFQGDQCDIIITVFNPPTGIKAAADRIMLNNRNILNVAISRASDYLFVLLPHPDSYGYENLIEINKLCDIANRKCQSVSLFNSEIVEKAIFDKKDFIEQNTFVTTHQVANVYTNVSGLYEIRIDENAVDIQTAGENYQPKHIMQTNVTNYGDVVCTQITTPTPEPVQQEILRPLPVSQEVVDTKSFTYEEQYFKYFIDEKLSVDSALELLFTDNTHCSMFTVLQIFGDQSKAHLLDGANLSELDVKKWRDQAKCTELGRYVYPLLFFAVRGQNIPIKGINKKTKDIDLHEFSEAVSAAFERRINKRISKPQKAPKKKSPRISETKSLYTYIPNSKRRSSSVGHADDDFEYGLSDW